MTFQPISRESITDSYNPTPHTTNIAVIALSPGQRFHCDKVDKQSGQISLGD
ncbi:MAG: hypothetical protein P8Z67_08675 [Gammaproteobacteria bacterium]